MSSSVKVGNRVQTRIWPSKGLDFNFPEKEAGVKQDTGVCFSGGGTRALSAAMGQLRGLKSTGLLEKVDYISCVSGGSWAAGAFTYYRSGASNDAEFLGPEYSPAQISMSELEQLSTGCLGFTATLSLREALEELAGKVPGERLWIEAVGKTYYEPFGMHDLNAPAGFSLNEETVGEIKARNPDLKDTEFYTVRTQEYRPYLIMNSALVGPKDLAPYHTENLHGFEYTPLYAGAPFLRNTLYDPLFHEDQSFWTGGGYLETFALGAGAPSEPFQEGEADLPASPRVFTLADASGTSSVSFADAIEHLTGDLSPQENYWPVSSDQALSQGGMPFSFADGGNLQNYGLIPLLQRGVKNIVVFINTPTPLSLDTKFRADKEPKKGSIDGDLPPLFGFPHAVLGATMLHNQVFQKTDFPIVAEALQIAKRSGKTVMTVSTLKTVPNNFWGLAGGETVNVCWVYSDRVADWEAQLPEDIKKQIDCGNPKYFWQHPTGPFENFPHYKTIDQNGFLDLVQLTPAQVNLLGHLSCWNVTENVEVLSKLL